MHLKIKKITKRQQHSGERVTHPAQQLQLALSLAFNGITQLLYRFDQVFNKVLHSCYFK
jgi:hypothetical protein